MERRPVAPLLVVGTMRSGTTLLNRLLGAHPEIAMVYAPTRFFEAKENETPSAFLERFEREYAEFGRMDAAARERLRRRFSALGPEATAADAYVALLDSLAGRDGARVVGEKYAGRGGEALAFRRLFPAGKLIVIVRDPRDVLLSNKKRIEQESDADGYWGGSHLLVLDDWATIAVQHRVFDQTQSGSYLQVRYEDLVGSPEESWRAICAFLDVPFSKAPLEAGSLRHDDGREWRANTSHGERYAALSGASVGAYKSKMSPAEVLLTETLLFDHMRFFGYALEDARSDHAEISEACALFLNVGAVVRRFGIKDARVFNPQRTEDENLLWFVERLLQVRRYGRDDFLCGFLAARALAARADVDRARDRAREEVQALRKEVEELRSLRAVSTEVDALRDTIRRFPTFLNVIVRLVKKAAGKD